MEEINAKSNSSLLCKQYQVIWGFIFYIAFKSVLQLVKQYQYNYFLERKRH